MTALWVLVGLLVLGVIAVVAGGRGDGLGPAGSDRPGPWLPVDRPVTGEDIDDVSFGVGFRGYRMDEVDEVLDRLAQQLKEAQTDAAQTDAAPTNAAPTNAAPTNAAPGNEQHVRTDDETAAPS